MEEKSNSTTTFVSIFDKAQMLFLIANDKLKNKYQKLILQSSNKNEPARKSYNVNGIGQLSSKQILEVFIFICYI